MNNVKRDPKPLLIAIGCTLLAVGFGHIILRTSTGSHGEVNLTEAYGRIGLNTVRNFAEFSNDEIKNPEQLEKRLRGVFEIYGGKIAVAHTVPIQAPIMMLLGGVLLAYVSIAQRKKR